MTGDGVFINLWLPPEWEEPMAQVIESFSTAYADPNEVAYDALVHNMVKHLKKIQAAGEATPSSREWWAHVQEAQQDYLDNG